MTSETARKMRAAFFAALRELPSGRSVMLLVFEAPPDGCAVHVSSNVADKRLRADLLYCAAHQERVGPPAYERREETIRPEGGAG